MNRPKPKPKPRPKPVAKSSNASSSGIHADSTSSTSNAIASSSSNPSSHKITYDNVRDDDEMFMRNQNDGWAKLRKITKESEQKEREKEKEKNKMKTTVVVSDSDSDNDNSSRRPSGGGASKRRRGEDGSLPRWQTDKKFARLLSQNISDGDSDSDDSITIQDVGNIQDSKLKRKRIEPKRARSKSITPPPALPQHQLEAAKEIIRRTLGGDRRSVIDLEDDHEEEETFIYDAQLAKIAQNVKLQSQLHGPGHTSSSVEPGGDAVNVTVRWEPHPLSERTRANVWVFKLDRTDNFSDLFENVAEEASVLSDNLVMTYRGKRFFSSVTPQTLNIWSDAEFSACDIPTYEYKRKLAAQIHSHPHPGPSTSKSPSKPSLKPIKPSPKNTHTSDIIDLGSDSDADNTEEPARSSSAYDTSYGDDQDQDHPDPIPMGVSGGIQSQSQTTGGGGGGDEEDQDKFKLVFRSALTTTDITLNVRSTTKCGAIVKAFLKKAGLADKYTAFIEGTADPGSIPQNKKSSWRASIGRGAKVEAKIPRLMIDGDKVSNEGEIGEHDLEDGDMVDVVDL